MSLVKSIFDIFTEIATWIVSAFTSVQSIFWTTGETGGGELSFLGVLMVISVGIGLVFLIIGIIQRFLHLRS